MTGLLRELLDERAQDVVVPRFDPNDLVAQGSRKVTQRRLVTIAAGVVAVALAAGLPFVVGGGSSDPEPAPPIPPETPSRALSYAEGRTIHLGDTTVQAGVDPVALDVTDDGVAFVSEDGRIWFTDGSEPEQIGATRAAQPDQDEEDWAEFPAATPQGWVESDVAGSLVAWFEYPAAGEVEIIVYDTHHDRVVERIPAEPAPGCENCAEILGVRDGTVHWVPDSCQGIRAEGPDGENCMETLRPFAYDLATGDQVRLSSEEYVAELRARSRMLERLGLPGEEPGPTTPFDVDDGIGTSFQVFEDGSMWRGGPGLPATIDTAAGERMRFEAPPLDSVGRHLFLFEWLDDDTIVLVDGGPAFGKENAALVTCTLSTHQCRVVVPEDAQQGPLTLPDL